MIEARGLTKRYGSTVAVDNLSFDVKPGKVTGFLGPNGAGKSTTMRMILGLDTPTSGDVRIDGQRYRDLRQPLTKIGALLDAKWVHPNRSARAHLAWMAASNKLPKRSVDKALEMVGLTSVANKRAGAFSLGMSQRLGIAGALLGDPGVLVFDDPVNGLDPNGIRWIRDLMRSLAAQGRTVLVSSHHISEMALTADQLLIIARGELITETSTQELAQRFRRDVFVRTPRRGGLTRVLTDMGATVLAEPGGGLSVTGLDAWRIASAAAAHYIPIQELTPRSGSLEDAYLELTNASVEYRAQSAGHLDRRPAS
jgi:ABC-2 type transport system ATP-binding protein